MLPSVVSATVAVRTIKLKCLGLVEIKHLKPVILIFLCFFFPEIVRNLKNFTILF